MYFCNFYELPLQEQSWDYGDAKMLGMRDCDFRFKEFDRNVLITLLSTISTSPERYAVQILESFDTFQQATRADHAILSEMIGDDGARLLRTIPNAVASMTRETTLKDASYFASNEAAKTHFAALLNGRRNEALAVIYLNARNRLIGEDVWEGSIAVSYTHLTLPTKRIV